MSIHIHLDVVVGDFLKGWAVDDEAPDVPLIVEVFADGRRLGSVVADWERKDLASDTSPDPRRGFRFVLPATLLTGDEREFTARVKVDGVDRASVTRTLVTTRLAFASPISKPWVASVGSPPAPIDHDAGELEHALELFNVGDFDQAIGLAREIFRANRELFVVDTGIVEAVSRHTRVKTFQQLMDDRRHDWFESENHSVWQSRLAKKAAMRSFAGRNLVNVPRQIAHFSDPDDLLTLDLPHRYVAKPDGLASAKGVFAVSNDVNVFTGKPITRDRIVENWRKLAAETGRIDTYIVEEFVADRFAPAADAIPLDYKFYVFGGTAGFLEVFDRNYPAPARSPYSITWRPLPLPLEIGRTVGTSMRQPDNLDELIEVAERLGREFGAFCRVDLFNGPNGPVLGEVTVLPANGKNRTEYANLITQQAYVVFEEQHLWSDNT